MGNMPSTITCNGTSLVNAGDNSGLYLGPATNSFFWRADCGKALSTGDVYQVTQETSWYDCAYRCDLSNMCSAIVYDSGSCTQYADFDSATAISSPTGELFTSQSTLQGPNCVPGEFQGYLIQCGVDYSGGDIGSQNDMKFKDCIALCSSTTGCIDVAYDAGSCYLKGSVGAQVQNPTVWTAKKKDATQGLSCVNNFSDGVIYAGYQIQCGMDYAGGDMGSTSTSTLEQCISQCSSTSGCIDVSYNGNMCYMKSSLGKILPNGAVTTAKKIGAEPSTPDVASSLTCVNGLSDGKMYTTSKGIYQVHCDADYYGGDLSSQQTATFSDCIAACDVAPGCVDVSYTGNACYLKNTLTSLTPTDGVWTAVLQSAVVSEPADTLTCINKQSDGQSFTAASGATFQIACGTDYYGGDLSSGFAATFQACVDLCDSTSGCVTVAHRGTSCYLKNQITPAKSDAGVWGAIKAPSSTTTTTATTMTTTTATTTTTTTPPATPASPTCLASACTVPDFTDFQSPCCTGTFCSIKRGYGRNGNCETCGAKDTLCHQNSDCCSGSCSAPQLSPQYGYCA